MFPQCGDVGCVDGAVEDAAEEVDAIGTEVLHVENRNIVRASCGGILALPDYFGDHAWRERV